MVPGCVGQGGTDNKGAKNENLEVVIEPFYILIEMEITMYICQNSKRCTLKVYYK